MGQHWLLPTACLFQSCHCSPLPQLSLSPGQTTPPASTQTRGGDVGFLVLHSWAGTGSHPHPHSTERRLSHTTENGPNPSPLFPFTAAHRQVGQFILGTPPQPSCHFIFSVSSSSSSSICAGVCSSPLPPPHLYTLPFLPAHQ